MILVSLSIGVDGYYVPRGIYPNKQTARQAINDTIKDASLKEVTENLGYIQGWTEHSSLWSFKIENVPNAPKLL